VFCKRPELQPARHITNTHTHRHTRSVQLRRQLRNPPEFKILHHDGLLFFFVPFVTNLLQLVDILCLLDVELQNVQDTSEDVQHGGGNPFWRKDIPHDTVGILKLDGSHKLGGQGIS